MRPIGEKGPASSEALFAVDGEQRIVAWNREAVRLFGHDLTKALGAHCYDLVGASDRKGHRFCRADCPVITAAIGGAPPPTLRLQSKSAAGETVPIDVSTIVLYSDDSVAAVIHLCRPADGRLPAAAAAAGQPPLTLREQQVLGCLCDGHSTHEIAAKLKISETTVRNHVQHLLDKLAVHSRAEVVALAYHDNLLS